MRHPLLFHLFTPVSRIKGVGAAASEALMRLLPAASQRAGGGLPIIRDLLFHLPTGFVDRKKTYPLYEVPDGAVATFVVKVDEHIAPPVKYGSKKPYKVICSNETGDIMLIFFHMQRDYLKQTLPIGQMRVISGKCEHFDHRLQMPHPDIIAPVSQLADVQKSEPVYPLTLNMTSRKVAKLVDEALSKLEELPEWQISRESLVVSREQENTIDYRLSTKGFFPSFKQALTTLHHPESEAALAPDCPAKLRLVYDEILAHQLQLALLRAKMQRQKGVVITGDGSLSAPLIASLPYQLTAGQAQVLYDIACDLASGHRMTRLLQGDVGSGKTIVALLTMLKAVEQGLQCAFMAPTELIARQHAETIFHLLTTNDQRPTTILLTGSIKGAAREEALAKIASGEAKIIIGTHALFQDKVEFKNLSLVVIDEQHRFGVEQRMALTKKGDAPHILHMTATPIPRSLTMMLYGDMECSLLKEKPAERKPIATRLIPRSRYAEVVERLKAALDRGEKAYWICPLVDDQMIGLSDDQDIAAVKTRHAEFTARFGPIVSLVHGRMKADERNEQMHKFASGESKLLVATTVVEVGVDVRDATIMVIEQAERFGLSQLHQLRGRVGRGERASACVLLYSDEVLNSPPLEGGVRGGVGAVSSPTLPPPTQPSPSRGEGFVLARLRVLRETEDGFRIAEEDLKLRGGGELLGVRQSGSMGTIFVDFVQHAELIAKGRDEVKRWLDADPELKTEHGEAARILLQLFEREVEL